MWIISRRILSAALAVGFVCTAVCGPAIAAQKTLSTDIVIVGAGSAGLTAAVQAAEKGANVVLLEKNFFVGGASNFAEGIFAVESELNRLRSDTLTREEAFKHAREMHMYEVNVPMMRDYIYGSADNVDWFMKHGVKFDVIRMTPWEEATWHVIGEYKGKNHGAALVANLKDQCDKLGVTTLTGTPAESLITDKSGAVVGVKAKSKTDDYTINAKAVILASGSISDSNEKVAEWAHRDAKHWHSSVNVNKTVKDDKITLTLPSGKTLDDNYYTITVTDNKGKTTAGIGVTLKDKNNSVSGATDANGQLIMPTNTHNSYVVGYEDGAFKPENNMTRAEAAAIFARNIAERKGENISSRKSSFKDVSSKDWFNNYIAYLEKYKVISGYDDKTFKPDEHITRAEFVTMCMRFYALDAKTVAAKKNIFNDVPKSHWASGYIYSAVGMGWINGYSDSTFKPDSNITRAEVVTIVNRVTGRAADTEYINKNMSAVNKFTDLKDKSYWAFYEILEASNTHNTVDGKSGETWVK